MSALGPELVSIITVDGENQKFDDIDSFNRYLSHLEEIFESSSSDDGEAFSKNSISEYQKLAFEAHKETLPKITDNNDTAEAGMLLDEERIPEEDLIPLTGAELKEFLKSKERFEKEMEEFYKNIPSIFRKK